MKLRGKALAGASALAMAAGMVGMAAPAHAAVTTVGACSGAVSLVKITSPIKGVGITDQTVRGVKTAGALAKDTTTKTAIGGTCSGVYRGGDAHVPTPGVGSGNLVLSGLSPKAQSSVLSGNASCANGATATAADATAADAYPLNGKITWTFNDTYTDLITAAPKPYKMQADVVTLGFDTVQPDVLNLGGIVLSGVNAGALLETAQTGFASSIWFNPVVKANPFTGGLYNTGYNLDLGSAAGCADGTPNNANLTLVITGGGGSSNPSGLGSNANGVIFEFGAP